VERAAPFGSALLHLRPGPIFLQEALSMHARPGMTGGPISGTDEFAQRHTPLQSGTGGRLRRDVPARSGR
jgi:hypothetical protein